MWTVTVNPSCGENHLVGQLLIDICYNDAVQALHLLLEGHAIVSLPLVVKLMEEACCPFIN